MSPCLTFLGHIFAILEHCAMGYFLKKLFFKKLYIKHDLDFKNNGARSFYRTTIFENKDV